MNRLVPGPRCFITLTVVVGLLVYALIEEQRGFSVFQIMGDVIQRLMTRTGYVMSNDEWIFVDDTIQLGRHELQLGEVDNDSFKVLRGGIYAADAKRVWMYGMPIIGVDRDSFKPLSPPYSKDDKQVYCGTTPIMGSDPGSIEVLLPLPLYRNPHWRDGDSVEVIRKYYGVTLPLQNDDRVFWIDCCWAKDRNRCYYGAIAIENAQPNTFVPVNRYFARDGSSVFAGEFRIDGADVKTFRLACDYGDEYCGNARDAHASYDISEIQMRLRPYPGP